MSQFSIRTSSYVGPTSESVVFRSISYLTKQRPLKAVTWWILHLPKSPYSLLKQSKSQSKQCLKIYHKQPFQILYCRFTFCRFSRNCACCEGIVIKIQIHWLFRAPRATASTIYTHPFSSLLHPHLTVAALNFSEKLSRFVLVQQRSAPGCEEKWKRCSFFIYKASHSLPPGKSYILPSQYTLKTKLKYDILS